MIRSSESYPLYALLSSENNIVYHIPAYQREYTWTKDQWGFRLVALSTDQPWSATPVYVSDVFTPAGNSDTDAVIVGEDFPLGDYRVLIATSQFLYLDAGRVTIGEDDGFIAMLFETAPPGLLAATILSFLVFIAALIAVFVQLIRRRSQ